MESNLRPLSLGEILDRTAQLYRTNFLLFAGIFAVYAGVVAVLNLLQIGLTSWLGPHPAAGVRILSGIAAIIEALLIFLFAGAAMAAINRAVAWVHLGEPATIRGAYQSILPHLGRYLWLMFLVAFYIWAPFLVVCVIAGVGIALVPGIASGGPISTNPQAGLIVLLIGIASLLILLWVVYAIWMALRYSLAVLACVVENLKARKAIRRSVELSKGARGRIFMLWLLVFIIEIILIVISQFFIYVLAFLHNGHLGPVAQAISQVIGFFTNSFLGPIYATGLTLFYYDQRVRKEGYDIEWMMQAAGLTVTSPAAELPAPDSNPAATPAPEATHE
jgi:hypothetical protein